jgi:hypothetical protein
MGHRPARGCVRVLLDIMVLEADSHSNLQHTYASIRRLVHFLGLVERVCGCQVNIHVLVTGSDVTGSFHVWIQIIHRKAIYTTILEPDTYISYVVILEASEPHKVWLNITEHLLAFLII